jgi:ABC-type polysaccharide/polyol phosphate transport system ATPase subunit
MSVIRLEGVSKTYSRRASRQFLRSVLLGRLRPAHPEAFYALKRISLDLKQGDSLAVIGANGAGKSTLLSVIAGLSWPDEGQIQVNGQIAALLELGSGFHPDLTGAENVRLNAALLGLSRARAREKADEVVEFSGIGDFIDEPLRAYSAGMVMRLAFSVAMTVDPDILLIDEVLAVGDQAFQAKCTAKIMELKRQGRVLICTSHVPGTLRQVCNRAIWLERGQVVREGSAAELLEVYEGAAGGRNP